MCDFGFTLIAKRFCSSWQLHNIGLATGKFFLLDTQIPHALQQSLLFFLRRLHYAYGAYFTQLSKSLAGELSASYDNYDTCRVCLGEVRNRIGSPCSPRDLDPHFW